MEIEDYAEQQRHTSTAIAARAAARQQTTLMTGEIISTGDYPIVSIQFGQPIQATNLGGLLRVGDTVMVQSDGLNHYVRGQQSL
jgi:hypothetical protein